MCICSCGTARVVTERRLLDGSSTSCGCSRVKYCSVDGCTNRSAGSSPMGLLCAIHRNRYKRHGGIENLRPHCGLGWFEDRFISKWTPEPNTGCWLWFGWLNSAGYGMLHLDGKQKLSHREFYERAKGPIPHGLDIDHLCRVRNCVNPDHLEAVTRSVNLARGMTLNKMKTHCLRGHLLAGDNVRISPGRRQCKVCVRMRRQGLLGGQNVAA